MKNCRACQTAEFLIKVENRSTWKRLASLLGYHAWKCTQCNRSIYFNSKDDTERTRAQLESQKEKRSDGETRASSFDSLIRQIQVAERHFGLDDSQEDIESENPDDEPSESKSPDDQQTDTETPEPRNDQPKPKPPEPYKEPQLPPNYSSLTSISEDDINTIIYDTPGAAITEKKKFVTCKYLSDSKYPVGTIDQFGYEKVWVWAQIYSPEEEIVTLEWRDMSRGEAF